MWVSGQTVIATGGNTSNVYNSTTNRIQAVPYDNAGNQQIVNGNTLTYDAENRQVGATEPPAFGGGTEQYLYDGDGRRVAKTGPSGTTVYVYDAAGQLAAEYSNSATAASPCQTCYLSYDHLGSVRMVTDQTGAVVSRHDYLPFGEEIQNGQSGRTGQFATAEGIQQRFTGKERDMETGLDFSQARYYGSALGRFTSIDPDNAGAEPENPQSWNAYSYVFNNPLVNVDPFGLDCKRIAPGPLGDLKFIGNCSSPELLKVGQGDQPQTITVTGQQGSWLTAVGTNAILSLSNFANSFFSFIAPKSQLLSETPTGQGTAAQIGNGLGFAATLIGGGGEAKVAVKLGRYVKNVKLRNFLAMFNRTGTGIGTGSTADAIRYEIETGKAVGGKLHFTKGMEMRQGLLNLVRSGKLDASDKAVAKKLLTDIQDALSTPRR